MPSAETDFNPPDFHIAVKTVCITLIGQTNSQTLNISTADKKALNVCVCEFHDRSAISAALAVSSLEHVCV